MVLILLWANTISLKMKVFKNITSLQKVLNDHRKMGKTVGFVPTMGALHKGHLSLIEQAKLDNDICVCSIFVNPTQFNNKEDLIHYPRQMDQDFSLLDSLDCDYVFTPEVDEMYPANEIIPNYELGKIASLMEGINRPGHFQGVATIVKKLFEIVKADRAYFGKKDYQQWLIIKELNRRYKLNTQIIGCEIIREADGLAMSSRNQRLSREQREVAPNIYRVLKMAQKKSQTCGVSELRNWVKQEINGYKDMDLSYFEICDADTLESITSWGHTKVMGFIVVNVGEIRLIDNISLR